MDKNNNELKDINKKIVMTVLLGSFGVVFFALGLYGMVSVNGNFLHPLLNDQVFVVGLIVIGVIIEVWQLYKLIPLFSQRKKLIGSEKK